MNTIKGDHLNNKLNGTSGVDTIFGYGGIDDIKGFDGNDLVYGGHGQDYIYGGEGDDILWGEIDQKLFPGYIFYEQQYNGDEIWGGKGNDKLGERTRWDVILKPEIKRLFEDN